MGRWSAAAMFVLIGVGLARAAASAPAEAPAAVPAEPPSAVPVPVPGDDAPWVRLEWTAPAESTSKKSGVLVVHSDRHVGKTFFRKGQIYFASIENQFNIGPRKALTRMLGWSQGQFELEPPDEA